MTKTIFITSFHGLVSRILESGILDSLQRSEDLRIVIFVPAFKKKYFSETFADYKNVIIEGIYQNILPKRAFYYQYLTLLLLNTKTMRLTRKSFRGYKHYYQFIIAQSISNVFGGHKFGRAIFRKINYFFSGKAVFGHYFEKYKPDIVFATDVKNILDSQMLIEAGKYGITTIGMVRSWDYLTGKGIIRAKPDKMIVHNETVKSEARKYADMKEENIFVSGLPHFDPYINFKRADRKTFFRKIGLDEGKKILFYAPWGDKFSDTDWQFLKMMTDAIHSRRLPADLVLLVRLPPGDTMELKDFKPCEHIAIDSPGVGFEGQNRKDNEMNLHDLLHLANSLFFSEVVITPPSTIVIDAAAFDKPIIVVAFDGYKDKKYFDGVKHYFDFCHIEKLIKTGGTNLARSEDELMEIISKYLTDPTLDREGRKMIVKEQCFKLDGKSSQRIADFIFSFLN